SRRRHTRLVSDWSSDVCSSDLELLGGVERRGRGVSPSAEAEPARAGHGGSDQLADHPVVASLRRQPFAQPALEVGALEADVEVRSEERRVGKEWRAGWRGGEYK